MIRFFLKVVATAAAISMTFLVVTKADEQDATKVAKAYFEAFANHDAAKMGELYAPSAEVIFADPVFTGLNTLETQSMWELLLKSPQSYEVKSEMVRNVGGIVITQWTAKYIFSKFQRPVTNLGTTVMKIENGKIVQQTDSFDLCKWFVMALPPQASGPYCLNPDLFRVQMRDALNKYMVFKKGNTVPN